MVISKPDTSQGFRPRVVFSDAILAPAVGTLRLDGRLESALLSPAIHQLILSMARLRNVVSSLRIEGRPVDLSMARRAIETGRFSTLEEREVLILARAYEELHKARRPASLSVEAVCGLHARFFPDGIGLDGGPVGRLKTEPNGVYSESEGRWVFEATPPERTRAELEALLDWLDTDARSFPPAVAAALFFAEFQGIHPFADGNGRVGRYLNVVVLKSMGYRNIGLVPLDGRFFRTRYRYYRSLRTTNSGRNYQVWCRYFVGELARAYQISVSRADLRPLIEKFSRNSTRSLLEWCLSGEGVWFQKSDFPNPKSYSGPAITSSLAELVKNGILARRGAKKGTRYRLSTEFLQRAYGREFTIA